MSDEKKLIVRATVLWIVALIGFDIGFCVLWIMSNIFPIRILICFVVVVSNVSAIIYLIWWNVTNGKLIEKIEEAKEHKENSEKF